VAQTPNVSLTSMAVNPANNTTYYTSGATLWKIAYSATGANSPVLVHDFVGVLANPRILSFDHFTANSLIIGDGVSVYRFTNVGIN
jgi:hypothetical protein